MSRSREIIKVQMGRALEVVAPWVRRDLDMHLHSGRFLKLKRWILYARTTRAKARKDNVALEKGLVQFWQADTADDYYDKYLDRYEKWFLGPHHEIVDQLAMLTRGGRYTRLIEVGCGQGRVLEHCAATMPDVQSFVGVDINPAIIARNEVNFGQNPRMQFLCADAPVWLQQNSQAGSILMTYGGVMEYFSDKTLNAMFRSLAQYQPAAVALVEPVDPAHDLENDAESHVFGQENSFSHNHQRLLEAANYRVVFVKTLQVGGVSWVILLATSGQPGTLQRTTVSKAA